MAVLRMYLYAAVAAIVSFPAALWLAYVASVLWSWFIVPIGVPSVGALHMLGISYLASYFLLGVYEPSDNDLAELFTSSVIRTYGAGLLWAPLCLLAGWIIQGLI